MSNNSHPQSTADLTVKKLRSLSKVLDNLITIPGTKISIGVDPILGLLPIAGDYIGLILSAYIILQAGLLGLPKQTLIRMIINIIIDTLVGTIPLLGDFFDFTFKANIKNLELLEGHLNSPQPSKKADKLFVYTIIAVLIFMTIAISTLTIWIITTLVKFIFR
jgi:Domain of unknown function (DUF4112)